MRILMLLAAICVVAPQPSDAADLHDLDFLIGEWVVHSYSRNEAGEFVEAPATTLYRARFLFDGLSILAEFYSDNREGFYGVHMITVDPERGLVHDYFNARKGRRLEFTGLFQDGEYQLSRRGGYGGGDFMYRETDSEISSTSFVKRIYQSDDGGKSWVEGHYYFRFQRVGP